MHAEPECATCVLIAKLMGNSDLELAWSKGLQKAISETDSLVVLKAIRVNTVWQPNYAKPFNLAS